MGAKRLLEKVADKRVNEKGDRHLWNTVDRAVAVDKFQSCLAVINRSHTHTYPPHRGFVRIAWCDVTILLEVSSSLFDLMMCIISSNLAKTMIPYLDPSYRCM